MTTYLIVSLLALLAVGVPVAFAIGLIGVGALVLFDGPSLTQLAQSYFSNLDSFILLAIPFFILAGNLMVRGALAAHIYGFMRALTRPITGGPAMGGVLASAIFGSMSGSSAAAAAALGRVTIPELDRMGFPRRVSAGLMAAGGTLSVLIPPSIVFVIYGALAKVSVAELFLAGIIPGLFLTAAIGAVCYASSVRNRWCPGEPMDYGDLWRKGLRAVPALLMPAIILGGIYSGVFTPTEAAASSALYAMFVGVFIYRSLRWRDIPGIFSESAKMTGSVLMILAGAIFIGLLATAADIPQQIVGIVERADLSRWQFLLVVNVVFLILGCFLDGITLLVVIVPMLLPAVRALDIDLIHFAILVTVNIEVASITPPIGINLFVISGVSGTPLEETIRGSVPYVLLLTLCLLLITYFPAPFLLGGS